jgi:small conductance mechanosensitive channel
MPDLQGLYDRVFLFAEQQLLPILLILVVAFLFLRFSRLFLHGVFKALMDREASEGTAQELSAVEVQKRIDTLDALGSNVLRFFVIVIAGLMILRTFGIDIAPAIAGLGIVGIAVGFGAQHLVRDYLNGALILIENQFSKGDVVRISDVTGAVEDFSLRRTTLRDLDGNVHVVPNGEIKVATNMTRTWARINENLSVAYGTDIRKVIEVVADVGRKMADDPEWNRRILEPPQVLRVDSFADSGITIKVLGTVRAADRWAAAGEFRRRVLDAFAEAGIEIPFPHRVIVNRPAEGGPEQAGGSTTAGQAALD